MTTDTRDDTRSGGGALSAVAHSPAADRLKDEARAYLMAQAERALIGVGRKLGETTTKLTDVAEGRSPGFRALALEGGRKLAAGKGPLRSAVEVGGARLKDSVKEALSGALRKGGKGGKGGSGGRPTVILEYVDVGVPVSDAYDQWTRFEDFANFTKGVQSADTVSDTESDWRVKVFWSSRSWRARITDQVRDERIAWTSEGAKGTTRGAVTFHPLADRLTRVVLVIEYYPQGLFEKTGNLWRAQGRRARLDLKHYARHLALRPPEDEEAEHEDAEHEDVEHEDAGREGAADEPDEDAYEDEARYEDDEPDADDERDAEDAYAEDEPDAEDTYAEDAEDAEDDAYEGSEDDEEGEEVGEVDEGEEGDVDEDAYAPSGGRSRR
ncbi:SRPBCC family protein [Streptomyces sp. G45]|uniref:SRPBCC family protein n=1 Tax=Streptomyces sp. G45 TaxID=3406627 RepID=UPI003C1AA34B